MARGNAGKCMCVCKRTRTARSSIRMGWDNMVSEATAERFVFRARAGPVCRSECSKMHLCGHGGKAETAVGTVYAGLFDACATKVMHPMNQCVRRHRFCMTTMSHRLDISVLVPSSTGVFEKAGPTRFPCVFVAVLRCAHTLACIIRGLTSTCSFTSYVRSSGPPCSVQP